MAEIKADNYDHWFIQVSREWIRQNPATRTERYGQFLYNRMPDRFLNKIPRALDPYHDNKNVGMFLYWLESHWDD